MVILRAEKRVGEIPRTPGVELLDPCLASRLEGTLLRAAAGSKVLAKIGQAPHADSTASTDRTSASDLPNLQKQSKRFVAVEGCNGAGKSTVSEHLARIFGARLFHFPPEFIRYKEESDLDLRVRAVPRFAYYLGGALELSDLVRESLRHSNVVCDRYFPSSMLPAVAFDQVSERRLCEMARPFIKYIHRPHLVLFLRVTPSVGIDRILRRARITGQLKSMSRQMIRTPQAFAACDQLLRHQIHRLAPVVELDTTCLTADQVCSVATAAVERLLEGHIAK